MSAIPEDRRRIEALLAIMARLRNPDGGCPWDLEQSFETIAPYTIEEAYEVQDAIHRGTPDDIRDELGDVLFQVVFQSQIAAERELFAFADVVEAIATKMIRRHPHVFGDGEADTSEQVLTRWEDIKAAERAEKSGGTEDPSVLDDVPVGLPALLRTAKMVKRVRRIGFDWDSADHALDKVFEEAQELRDEIRADADADRIAEEMGDLLFTVANVAHKLGLNPEETLAAANRKFERRFRGVEARLKARGRSLEDADLAEMDAEWDAVKRDEKASRQPGVSVKT